jgi:hypothetical protein
MTVLRSAPRDFGRWVGGYSGFWHKVEHDDWIKKLYKQYPKVWVDEFWNGYGDARPQFKEKQLINQAYRDYEKSERLSK